MCTNFLGLTFSMSTLLAVFILTDSFSNILILTATVSYSPEFRLIFSCEVIHRHRPGGTGQYRLLGKHDSSSEQSQ